MKNLSFVLLLSFLPLSLWAQTPREVIDSLKIQLTKSPAQADKAQIFGDLCWYYNSFDLDSSLYYGEQALKLANELKDRSLLAQTLSDLGAVHFLWGNIDESTDFLERSLEIRKEEGDEERIASLESKLGNNLFKKNDFQGAMEYYISALDFYEKANNPSTAAILQGNIGNTYYTLNNYPKALEYFKKSEESLEQTNLDRERANILLSMGNVYKDMFEEEPALEYYEEAIEVAKKGSNALAEAAAYNNIGGIHFERGRNAKAIDYIEKGLKIREEHGLTTEVANSLLSLAEVYNGTGRYADARNFLYRSLKIFNESGIHEKLGHIYFQLTKAFIGLGEKDSANLYVNQFSHFQEENFNEDVLKITGELETKYETNKKEKLILEQKVSLAEQQLTIMKKNRWISIFIGLVVLSAMAAFTLYYFQKLKNDRLRRENELKDALIRIEAQSKVQEERLRISRDLHDNIGSQLTFIVSSLDNLKFRMSNENPELTSRLEGISHFTRTTIGELRGTIWAMNKGSISFEDLKVRLTEFFNNAKAATPDISFNIRMGEGIDDKEVFTAYEGINLFRIIQEAINNAIKHSGCTQIDVSLEKAMEGYEIRVRDNGKGIAPERREGGNGLGNMRKRAEDMGGKFFIDALPGGGTEVRILV